MGEKELRMADILIMIGIPVTVIGALIGIVQIIIHFKSKKENKKSSLEIGLELQNAINAVFSDDKKKQDFTGDYVLRIRNFLEKNQDTFAILDKFQKAKGFLEFIKYLEGFFKALLHWSEEKLNSWTLLSKKQKEAEFVECMKHVDNGKLEEFQLKCARFQSVIPETIFFLDPQNYIK
jgi:hypothetical protein